MISMIATDKPVRREMRLENRINSPMTIGVASVSMAFSFPFYLINIKTPTFITDVKKVGVISFFAFEANSIASILYGYFKLKSRVMSGS